MSSKGKGKEVATYGKRKQSTADDKRGKRNRSGVLQFFEDAADAQSSDDSDESDFDEDDFMEEEPEINLNSGTGKSQNIPFVPKEEVIEEAEFDRMMEERYKSGAGFVRYADDPSEAKGSIDKDSLMSSNKDPTLWKVKSVVGRERHSVFCLMKKFVDLKVLGNKLQIISVFSVDHVKGFIYIEADKECDIGEACKGLSAIYYSRVMPVPANEVSHLLSVRTTTTDVSAGMWARVKNGKYKGDLAQVVAVNSARKRATVKLIPRIDLQALAGKFGGGSPIKKTATPAPRLLSSSELEEFRPLIQYRCDRDTGKRFEVLDGLMLKDGFLYKKVSIDSLSFWGIMPQEEELLRFKNSESSESVDTEWLSQLYGDRKSRRTTKNDKGGSKGESSSSSALDSFELYNLVCFGRKDFGLILGKEKDDYYKILKEGSEGPVVVTVERRELKSGPLDARFSALDHQKKLISINDTVKVLEGPSKDKQGMVKQIYRGTVFLYDENETENGGYFCCRSQMCDKIKLFADPLCGKDDEPGPFEFGEFPSSPKSPLVEEKPWQARESKNDFNRDKDGLFSIGQTLRIRVGPLKGYLCRVLAVRRSDVTVKLDSQQKVLTVKNEHLCEVNRKNTVASSDNGASSFKPFDLLGSEGCSGGWGDGTRTSTENNGWNTGGLSAEGNSWPSFTSSGAKPEEESNSLSKSSWDTAPKKDDENSAWGQQLDHPSKSSWDTAPNKDDETNAWGQQSNDPNKSSWDTAPKKDDEAKARGQQFNHPNDETNAWGQQSNQTSKSSWDTVPKKDDEKNAWGQQSNHPSKSSWDTAPKKDNANNACGQESNQPSKGSWDTAPKKDNANNAWGQESNQPSKGSWDTAPKKDDENNAWGKLPQGENPSWGAKAVEQGSEAATAKQDQDSVWGKKTSASQDSSWGNKGNSESGFGNANKSNWSSAAADTKLESGWGGKESWKSGSTSASQDSGWGNKGNSQSGSGDANKSNWSSAAVDMNQESGWSAKGNWKSGSSSDNQGSGWGSSSNWQSGSGEANKNSTRSSGGKWNSGRDSSDDISGAKKSNWNTGAGDSDWDSKGSWKQGSTSASQDSGWGNKGNWQSGSGDANKNSTWSNNGKWNSGDGNEDQSESFGNRGNGGNWRGRERGDRGGFRGRGRSDRGDFGGRGRNDTEGFGGRGGDRGGFRARGERGRFGGRGRGRRDDWNGNNESADGKSFSWGKETNNDQGWKQDDSGVKRNPESSSGGSWKGWNLGSDGTKQAGGWNNQGSSGKDADSTACGWKSSSWNQSANEKETTDGNGQGGGWNKGSSGGSDTGGWNNADQKPTASWGNGAAGSWGKSGDGGQSSGGSLKGWNSGSDGTKQAGGWNNQGSSGKDAVTTGSWKSSSWNQSTNEKQTSDGNGQGGGWNKVSSGSSDTGGWKQSSVSGVTNNGQSSSWEQKKDANADGKPSASWGDGAASSWGKSGDGSQSSAWNQSIATKEDTSASWGKSSDGGQASAWNQSKDAKEDANASWGKGSDGSSKGGW